MHGGAVTLAHRYRDAKVQADAILATDMLDLTTFLALTRDLTSHVPVILYMHENQLTYPVRPGEKRDLHYGFINYASMLCADSILFSSQYHLEAWFAELPRLLKHFPDHAELHTIAELRQRSCVAPLGLRLSELDSWRSPQTATRPNRRPVIVWNHRWEYDKNPGAFLDALETLVSGGVAFDVVFLGQSFVRVPPEFQEAQKRLGDRILKFGWVQDRSEYARWLWRADIVVSTAIHEFFGASVVEAIYCDCLPILPDRLSYPQFIPPDLVERCLYHTQAELIDALGRAIEDVAEGVAPSLRSTVARYDWQMIAPVYDELIEQVSREQAHRAS